MAIDPKSPDGFPTDQINDWVFDLDNTIYPAKSNLFVRVAVRITAFVAQHFKVPEDEARVIPRAGGGGEKGNGGEFHLNFNLSSITKILWERVPLKILLFVSRFVCMSG